MNKPDPHLSGMIETPVTLSTTPYVSEAYAREEKDRLWLKVWQVACREEEIPEVGDFYTYDILDQSVIIVRLAEDKIAAHHNVCRHRGRRLTNGCGRAKHIYCPYHGWKWDLQGRNTDVPGREDWDGFLDEQLLDLGQVKVGRWGGFVFVNLDPECEPLEQFLQEVPYWLGPFQTDRMRYKWRQWLRYDCNWKVMTEAFIETYHAPVTHPQTNLTGSTNTGGSSEGLHGRLFQTGAAGGGVGTGVPGEVKVDVRELPLRSFQQTKETVRALYTDTFIAAAETLPKVLPEDASPADIGAKLLETACRIDAERGMEWPEIDPEHLARVGVNWHVFPNVVLLPNVTFCLGFRVRPDGFNPDSCILEVFALERFPKGQEPETEWEHKPEQTGDSWPLLIRQDFKNLGHVQVGMKSESLAGLLPNPKREGCVINFQRNLANYMGRCSPELL